MKIAIIGAGVAGLASARRAIEHNLECTVFEQTGDIGGTWAYTDNAFTDEFNNPVHSSLFAAVKLLTPAQLMEIDGLEFKPKSGSSYPGHAEVLEYYKDFAKKYDLQRVIKFYHLVTKIWRNSNDWCITVKDLKQNKIQEHLFDAVMICKGQYSEGVLPKIQGMETFSGDQIHAHNYRRKIPYKDKRLLIVGAGTSAMEIALDCLEVAKKIYLSYRSGPPQTELKKEIEIKPQVELIEGNEVHFADGTITFVDSIIYCTGYKFVYSFLDPSCGIEVLDNNILQPLYKMFINITHPTMSILGLPQRTIVPAMDDLQAQVFVKHLAGIIKLPSKEEMMESFRNEYKRKTEAGLVGGEFYNLGHDMKKYFDDLCRMANIKPLPEVRFRLREYSRNFRKNNYLTFRNQRITITDDENFTCEWPNDEAKKTKL